MSASASAHHTDAALNTQFEAFMESKQLKAEARAKLRLLSTQHKAMLLDQEQTPAKSQPAAGAGGGGATSATGSSGFGAAMACVVVPPLSGSKHKGQAGKVGVIGGCEEYTGAPYFAAMSALRAGADLASVFCTPEAAGPIKSYSPELMVWPALRLPKPDAAAAPAPNAAAPAAGAAAGADADAMMAVARGLAAAVERVTCVSVGSGLGREGVMPAAAMAVVARVPPGFPLILDADALVLLSAAGAGAAAASVGPGTVLTPNAMEFSRLYSSFVGSEQLKPISLDSDFSAKVDDALLARAAQYRAAAGIAPAAAAAPAGTAAPTAADGGGFIPWHHPWAIHTSLLALRLRGAAVVRKGAVDIISDGTTAMYVSAVGSARRCGGQGDVLAGVMAAFRGWAQPPHLSRALGNVFAAASTGGAAGAAGKADAKAAPVLDGAARQHVVAGAWAACVVLRECARRAGAVHPRSTVASDLLARVPEAMDALFPPFPPATAPADTAAAKL